MSQVTDVGLMLPFSLPIAKFTRSKSDYRKEREFVTTMHRNAKMDLKTSNETNILEREEMSELKKFFLESLNIYLKDIWKTSNTLDISQSWSNVLEPNDYHADHTHCGSILSICYYLDNTEETPIHFMSPHDSHALYGMTMNEYTPENCSEWGVKCESNELVIFPSFLRHKVPTNYTSEKRYNVVCNTQYKRNEYYGMPGKVNTVYIK